MSPVLADSTIAIVGLGLMGGSLGLALRGQVRRVIGVARREAVLQQALAAGAIDEGYTVLAEAAPQADILVLATPVRVILAHIAELIPLAPACQGLIVTDMGSTKAQICQALAALPATFQPIGGHPMCGKESSGLEAAEPGLYRGAAYVLCPLPRTEPATVSRIKGLVEAVGAQPLTLEPQRHDRLVAAISHVPYLAALATFTAAAELAEEDAAVWQVAASGFRSTTRLAGSDDQMMVDILLSNQEAVLAHLARVQAGLTRLATQVQTGDVAALRAFAIAARRKRSEELGVSSKE